MSARPLVLVVDDEPAIVAILEMLLSTDGYDVMSARDARAALVLAEEHGPALILLDLNMPVMNGRQFIEEYHRLTPSPAPVVLLTGSQAPRDLPGVAAYLPKPFRLEALSETVREQLLPVTSIPALEGPASGSAR